MKYRPALLLLGCLLLSSSVTAQFVQDPLDLGEADTVRMDFVLLPDAATNQLDVEMNLYVYNDEQVINSVSLGFAWENENLQMTDAFFSPEAITSWDLARILYRNGYIDSTNKYLDFQCTALRGFTGPGLVNSDAAKLVATYQFTLSSWSVLDSLVFDTAQVLGAGFSLVAAGSAEYEPYWDGRIVIYDQNRPILSNLVLSEDTLVYQAIAGEPNPPAQSVSILSDRDPLSVTLTEDISWLLKSTAGGVTPLDVSLSVTTTGLMADTYFDSVFVEAGATYNSPQFIFVLLELAPPLPVIDVNRDAFFFNALAGGENPSTQSLLISNAGQSTLNWSVTNNESWLTLEPTAGTGSGSVTLSVSTAGLTFGEYHDTVVVTDPAATNSPVRLPVRLFVASDLPVIEVDSVTNYWAVDYSSEGMMFTRSFDVRNGGAGTLDFWVEEVAPEYPSEPDYILNITPASSTAPESVELLFYTGGDPYAIPSEPLEIHESVMVLSNTAINSPVIVDCWIRFPPEPAVIDVSLAAVELDVYECYQGYGQELPTAEFTVENIGGDGLMPVNIVYESELFEVSGAETSQTAPATYTISATMPDLSLGTYYDTIAVTSRWATNKPQLIEVTFNYLATPEAPVIGVEEGMLEIPYQMESGPQVIDNLVIFNLNPGCLDWEIVEDVAWLTPVESSGQVPDASPLLIDPAGLAMGEYTETLEVVAPTATNSPAEIGLVLRVWKLRGDVNWNGRISVQDIALLIDYVFEGQHPPQPAELVADTNCDEVVDAADIILIVEYLFETLEPLCGNPY